MSPLDAALTVYWVLGWIYGLGVAKPHHRLWQRLAIGALWPAVLATQLYKTAVFVAAYTRGITPSVLEGDHTP